ncbi:MAG: SDR family oxidoreductase [Spirochaetia bacterium]|nr:SDR family oxidoreductase [Spirochaetia bacterium]
MGKDNVKKIIVFGASGKTGHQVVRYALEKGFHVTAMVRDKSKLTLKYHNLRVIKGNIINIKDVENAIKDQDFIVSALGVKPGQEPVCCKGITNILAAMKKLNVKRLVVVSAYGARETATGFYGKILNLFIKKIMQDKNEMEELIEKSSFDWTVVRPVILTNGLFSDKYNLQTEGTLTGLHFISREDTARFIVDSLETKDYKKKFVTIYN